MQVSSIFKRKERPFREEKVKKPPSRIAQQFAPIKLGTQKVGNIMSGCIMPVIGVIIAWGIATAFFIPSGWTPVAVIDKYVVGTFITWLIPMLIGFMGGYNVYKIRGGMMGAFTTACVIASVVAFSEQALYPSIVIELNGQQLLNLGPQFLTAMIAGPLSALILKKTEALWTHRIKVGFEMLVNNFYFALAAIVMGAVCFFSFVFIAIGFNYVFGVIINWLTSWNGMPLTSLLVEPAKPLFLNNAINHGVFTPLGTNQVTEVGKSMLFLIESNPGPGMGLLLAILLFDKDKMIKGQAGGASIIHFFGGIHEVYFPFIIMRPFLVFATMAGGVFGVAMFQAFDVGARSPVSPGSVIAEYTFVNSSGLDYAGLSVGIFGSILVSGLVTVVLLKTVYKNKRVRSMSESVEAMNRMKGSTSKYVTAAPASFNWSNVNRIAFVCDAGMGSSAMGAGLLRKEIAKRNIKDVSVANYAITNTPSDAQVIVVQKELLGRVEALKLPAYVYPINQFLDKGGYDQLLSNLSGAEAAAPVATATPPPAPAPEEKKWSVPTLFIRSEKADGDRDKLMASIGRTLGANGVGNAKELTDTLIARAKEAPLFMGSGLILPHPTEAGRSLVKNELIVFQWFVNPITYEGNEVNFSVTLALKGNSHMDSLQKISEIFANSEAIDKAVKDKDEKAIRGILGV